METKLRVCNAPDTRADAWPFNSLKKKFVGLE
jgi:hypothetical protein